MKECPVCGRIFTDSKGLKHHVTRKHKEKYVEFFGERRIYTKPVHHGYDEETIHELNRQSDMNCLRMINGDRSKMTNSMRKYLIRSEILEPINGKVSAPGDRGGVRYRYSEKGLQMLKELEESGSP